MTRAPDPALHLSYQYCEDIIRGDDCDRWLASLFVPAQQRPFLHALYAFNSEIARVRESVSEPMPGEIRFQWWRDVLNNAVEGEARGDVLAHPVAAALLDTLARCQLPTKPLLDLIDARTFDLYEDPMPTLQDLEGYCGETCSILFRLAALIVNEGEPGGADASGHAGVAYAMAGLLRALPWQVANSQVYIPKDVLAKHGLSPSDVLARRVTPALLDALAQMRAISRAHLAQAIGHLSDVSPRARIVHLPIFLVEPMLARMERHGYHPFEANVDLPQWRRQWILWRSARKLS